MRWSVSEDVQLNRHYLGHHYRHRRLHLQMTYALQLLDGFHLEMWLKYPQTDCQQFLTSFQLEMWLKYPQTDYQQFLAGFHLEMLWRSSNQVEC